MTNQAWRIYYSDALAKTELTQSPARVKWAKEQGHRVVELVEVTGNGCWMDDYLERYKERAGVA